MLFAGKKGNMYLVLVFVVFFLAVWAFWLGPYIAEIGQNVVSNNSLTGLEAFFWLNLNLFIAVVFLIAVFIYFATGGK